MTSLFSGSYSAVPGLNLTPDKLSCPRRVESEERERCPCVAASENTEDLSTKNPYPRKVTQHEITLVQGSHRDGQTDKRRNRKRQIEEMLFRGILEFVYLHCFPLVRV